MAAQLQKFNSFVEAMAEKIHNLGSDTLKWALTNTAPNASFDQFSDITDIAAGNGYSAGGFVAPVTSSSQSGGTYSLVLAEASVTASGGTIGPFRYPVLYNDTAAGKEVIGWLDYGTSYTLPDGQPFKIPAGTALTIA